MHAFAVGGAEAAELHGQAELGAGIRSDTVQVEMYPIERITRRKRTVVVNERFVSGNGANGLCIGASKVEVVILLFGASRRSIATAFLAEFGLSTVFIS